MLEQAKSIVQDIRRCEMDIDSHTRTLNTMYKGRKVTYDGESYDIIGISNASGLNLYLGQNGVGTRCIDFHRVINGQAVVE